MSTTRKWSLLKNKNYLFLWLGQSISTLGNRFTTIAMMWFIIEKTGSPLALGVSVICSTLPSLVLMPFSGVLADKNKKKAIILSSNLLSGMVMLLITLCMTFEDTPLLVFYMLMLILSAISAFFTPAYSATIPLVVGKDRLTVANSLSQLTTQFANILGPALAGLLIALVGETILFFIDSLSFLFAAVMAALITVPAVKLEQNTVSFKKDFLEGLNFVKKIKQVLYLIIVGGVIINFFLAPLNVYLTIVCNQILKVGSEGLGVIDAMISLGAILGSLFIMEKFFKNNVRMAIFGLSIEGGALIIAGLFNSYIAFMIYALILGLGVSFASVGIGTLLQTMVPENKLGRVGSLSSVLGACTIPLGTLVGSIAVQYFSMPFIFILSGILVSLSGLSLILVFKYDSTGVNQEKNSISAQNS